MCYKDLGYGGFTLELFNRNFSPRTLKELNMAWPRTCGIRFKLISIFILIKVLPLIVLAWIAWNGILLLGQNVEDRVNKLSTDAGETINDISNMSVESSIRALDLKSRETIERLTTDTARKVAEFLYARDNDILLAASLEPSEDNYRKFLAPLNRNITEHQPWVLNESGDVWVPEDPENGQGHRVSARNPDNAKDFHSRPPDNIGIRTKKPLFLEMTYVDLKGNELIKITTSDLLPKTRKNIADKANTYCKAEGYFDELQKLKAGEVYVSEVIGPYLKSPIIGPYTKVRAEEKGIPFTPEKAGYAGKENPVGEKFKGLIRWASPVVKNGKIKGYVTLALDHTHLMEFTDHIVPTSERYTAISDASTGNYAFMWDYKDRNISHPRDYFIVGYDPETGQPAVPWLEAEMYDDFTQSNKTISRWMENATVFKNQSLQKKPSIELTDAGLLGLDCRFLNFAPQCDGWHNLTENGGSGSFVILWSGLWKLTTAAAIPYHTGIYSGKRGFGFITIGANVYEFHKAATETGEKIEGISSAFQKSLEDQNEETQRILRDSQAKTSRRISFSTLLMIILVIFIAIWMASTLTKKITNMIKGIKKFQGGDLDHRLTVDSSDEVGELATTFNEMSDDIQKLILDLRQAEEKYRGFFENATEGIFRTTIDGKLVNVNPAFAKLLGYDSPKELLSTVNDIGSQLYVDPKRRKQLIRELLKNGNVQDFEYEVRLPSGESRFLTSYCRLVTDQDGQIYLEGMSTDISERKLKEKAEIEKEAALSANKSKSEFLANMSHEIRTPLNAIMGMTEMLSESGLTDEQKKYVSLFKSAGESLLKLINEILDFSKIEAGQMAIHHAAFNLHDMLESLSSIMGMQARNKNLEFNSSINPDVPQWVKGDELRLKQILMNLLGNAVKFTDEGYVEVSVQASYKDERNVEVNFEIKDTGIGIDAGKISTVFDSFTQADSTATRQYGGTGLGLAISKRLAELMGGSIGVVSDHGEGSIFYVNIPFEVITPPKNIIQSSAEQHHKGSVDSSPKTILVVEDSRSNRLLLEHFLGSTEHRLIMAENGMEGLEIFKTTPGIDAILMDMQMPVMDGIRATEEIRRYEQENGLHPVMIIALTANAFEEDRKNSIEAGCDHYLSKPVKKADLINLLGEGIKTKEQ